MLDQIAGLLHMHGGCKHSVVRPLGVHAEMAVKAFGEMCRTLTLSEPRLIAYPKCLLVLALVRAIVRGRCRYHTKGHSGSP